MMTQRNMKTRRSLFSRIVLSLLVGIIGGLVWSGTSALAATVESTPGGGGGFGGGRGQTSALAPVESTLLIPISGTVTEPDKTIAVGGVVIVTSTMVTDANFGSPPVVLLTFDFSYCAGVSGTSLKTLAVYVTGGDQVIKMRPLQASDVIPITCPYIPTQAGILSADAWLVTTTLNFDVSTGKLTSGTATVGTNPYLAF